jgi:hypothetical protein
MKLTFYGFFLILPKLPTFEEFFGVFFNFLLRKATGDEFEK